MRGTGTPLGRAASSAFGALARVRGNRALHPHGVVLSGTMRAGGSPAARGSELFSGDGTHDVLARVSRGAGVPEPLPDVLGCALRVIDAYGPGRHQDFALASSGRRPGLRHSLLPQRDYFAAFYSSVLLYRIGGSLRMVGAEMRPATEPRQAGLAGLREAAGGRVEVSLRVAPVAGEWEEVAAVTLDGVVEGPAARLRFNPWNTGGGIQPAGPFMRLRDPAYRGSQSASPGA